MTPDDPSDPKAWLLGRRLGALTPRSNRETILRRALSRLRRTVPIGDRPDRSTTFGSARLLSLAL